MANKLLKAYLITYHYEDALKSVVIVAFSIKEAGQLFIKWLDNKNMLNRTYGVVVQRLRKTKRSKDFFTSSYYKRQLEALNEKEAQA